MQLNSCKRLNIKRIKKDLNINGFTIIKNFFTNSELNKIDQTLINIILSISKDGRFKNIKKLNTVRFTKLYSKLKKEKPKIAGAIYDSMQISLYLQSLFTSQKITNLISGILEINETNISNFFRTLRLDLPGKSNNLLSWHQDFMHSNNRNLNSDRGITIWAPINSVNENTGSMKICVSSHKKRLKIKLDKKKFLNSSEYLDIDNTKLSKFQKIIITCKRKDIVLMNMNCVHCSTEGKLNLIRRTIISRYIDINSNGFVPGASKFIPSINIKK